VRVAAESKGADGTLVVRSAVRRASRRLSYWELWFQLTNSWLTQICRV
jgi:hypothetical protein